MKRLKWPLIWGWIALAAACGQSKSTEKGDGGSDSHDDDDDDDDDDDNDDDDYEEEEDIGVLEFDPPSGTFERDIEVEIVSGELEGDIRFTTDGAPPTATSERYDGTPISISDSTELQADIFVDGEGSGTPSSAFYIERAGDISIDLPIAVIDNFGAGEPDREDMLALFMTFDVQDGTASVSNQPDVASRASFHLRGQSTATFEKKPYRLELRKYNDEDRDLPLLNMPPESDWALRGPFADKALIRDAFFYGLGADIGIASPKFAFFELYKNLDGGPLTADDYEGVYLMVETIKNSRNRTNLKQLREDDTSPSDITGGYIFKFEWMAAEEPIIDCPGRANCWTDLEVVDPQPLIPEQEQWLADHLYAFNDALHAADFTDPDDGYAPYIDATSFADQIIINELGREYDSYIRSAYFHKDRDGVIFAGPIWDYNLVFGVGLSMMWSNMETAGWTYDENITRQNVSNDWINRLVEDPGFWELLSRRWRELRDDVLSDSALEDRIDDLEAPLTNAAERNFERWPNLTSRQIDMFETPTEPTWEGQVQFIRDWLSNRVAWLDSQWR